MFDTKEENAKFKELYETYGNYMYSISYDIIRDTHGAEDAVHNAFMKIGRILDKIDTACPEKTKALLAAVMRNTAVDCCRKKKKMYTAEGQEQPESSTALNRVETDFINGYNYRCLADEIKNLPEKYRDVLLLRYLYELPIQGTAEQLSISETDARARISRAKTMLGEALYGKKQ